MSEQPNNVRNIDDYRSKVEAALFDSETELDFRKNNPNLLSLEEARARRLAQESFAAPEVNENEQHLESISRVGAVLEFARAEEAKLAADQQLATSEQMNAHSSTHSIDTIPAVDQHAA